MKKEEQLSLTELQNPMCRLVGGGAAQSGLKKETCKGSKICYNSDMKHHYCRKIAFTLAEVLITLGIIGIIAALTLPGLIQDYKKKQTTVKLKKFNSLMSQVVVRSASENGSFNDAGLEKTGDDFDLEGFFNVYLAPYISYKRGELLPYGYGFNVDLTDGTSFRIWKATCLEIYFDTNGRIKGPNTMGRDQYNFMMCGNQNSAWIEGRAWGAYRTTGSKNNRAAMKQACIENARFCSGLLEYDGWEFKEDYPYKL